MKLPSKRLDDLIVEYGGLCCEREFIEADDAPFEDKQRQDWAIRAVLIEMKRYRYVPGGCDPRQRAIESTIGIV